MATTQITVGDKIMVHTRNGDKLCVIDKTDEHKTHFKNKRIGLTVNTERIRTRSKSWRGAKYEYYSFN